MRIASLLVGLMLVFNVGAQPAIEFVVSAAPGGPNDTVTRKLVEKLEKDTFLKFIEKTSKSPRCAIFNLHKNFAILSSFTNLKNWAGDPL